VEYLIVALWQASGTDRTSMLDEWIDAALTAEPVEALSISLAVDDQPYTRDPVDALLALGLTVAHDLDDIPARDLLHHVARRVEVWRVDPRRVLDGPPDGVKMVSFMRRAEGLSHEQFTRHWTENHAPLAARHHIGLSRYVQNVVRRAYTPGGGDIDGIAELTFATRDDFETKFFDDDAGRAVIMEDVKRFMQKPGPETSLMSERALR
jgi:uncharacterized protein (TIGR02118 family)